MQAGLKSAVLSLLVLAATTTAVSRAAAQATPGFTVTSPDGDTVVTVGTTGRLTYQVSHRGRPVVAPSAISMTLAGGRVLGASPRVTGTTSRSVDQVLRPVVRVKRADVRDRFNERRIDFDGGFSLIVRACDDGIAWRFATRLAQDITVEAEQATFRFTDNHLIWFPEEASLVSHQERLYKRLRIGEVTGGRFSSLPAMVEVDGGPKIVITEADLLDYPGMDLTAGAGPHALQGLFPAWPTRVELRRDRNEHVLERAGHIAQTRGTREFPWRVLVIADEDEQLLETEIVYRLASDNAIGDTSWIAPGKVAWDWWNANNLYGVPWRAGLNTDTYRHFIDFAADHGLQYVILDEGWYRLGDLTAVVPEIDVPALAAHARTRNVGLVMWVVWKTFDDQMQVALDQFARWGVKGIKIDFMQREDQWMVRFYERAARAAAERRMIVDFHGAYKPTGFQRTFPNVLTSEGVVGLEHSKWSADASPDNAVTFPFMRMLAGPVDYTPGAMINAVKRDFRPVFDRPMSQGTRCHQLAMYVVYESPLQMLADSPSNYLREADSLAWLSAVPTTWDETRVLSAAVGEHILTARRSGREWYVGALTNWSPRELEVDLSFLGPGAFEIDLYQDGPNADRVGVDYSRTRRPVAASDRLRVALAPGGGLAARIRPR